MTLHKFVHVDADAEMARVVAAAQAPDTAMPIGVSNKVYVP